MARAKTTRKLSGRALGRYFEGVLEAEPDLATGPRRRVLDVLEREVAQIRVRMSAPARRRTPLKAASGTEADSAAGAPAPSEAAASPAAPVTAPGPATGGAGAPAAHTSSAEAAAPPAPPFNPYQFSAVAVMTRGGPEALLAKLEAIAEPANLRKLASAQHIAVPQQTASIDDLRRAIIEGVAQRIADRRAAAS